jgi:hypothetical protein
MKENEKAALENLERVCEVVELQPALSLTDPSITLSLLLPSPHQQLLHRCDPSPLHLGGLGIKRRAGLHSPQACELSK